MAPKITVYSLSTCHHCTAAKEYLDSVEIAYDCIYVDRLYAEERNEIMAHLRTLNPSMSFPTIVIDEQVIAGFRREEVEAALNQHGQV